MPYKPKDVVSALQKLGFYIVRQKGSHLHLKNEAGQRVTVPMHTKDLRQGTLMAILKQAQVDLAMLKQHLS